MMFLQLSSVMDLATRRGPGGVAKAGRNTSLSLGMGCKRHSSLTGTLNIGTRSARQEGVVSPSPSKGSWSVMQNKSLHYPPTGPCCPVPLPWQQGDAGDCPGKVVLGTIKPSAEALSPPLSHSTDVWNVLGAFIKDLSISSSWKCF